MLTELLNTAIEIEGLIRVLRDGDAAPEVYALLKEKTAFLAAEAIAIETPAPSAPAEKTSFTHTSPTAKEEERTVPVERIFRENTSEAADDDIILSFEDETPIAEPQAHTPHPKPTSAAVSAAAKESPSLKSLFSLNDRFLFSRELFGGDMKMFDSTLKFIDGIKDFADIEDYFYGELEWNPEDPNVAAYLDIIRPHFPE